MMAPREVTVTPPVLSLHVGATKATLPSSSSCAPEFPTWSPEMAPTKLLVIDTTPVRSKAPVLLGEDPYYTEQVVMDGAVQATPRNRTNVLDSFDLGDSESRTKMPWPERLVIKPE